MKMSPSRFSYQRFKHLRKVRLVFNTCWKGGNQQVGPCAVCQWLIKTSVNASPRILASLCFSGEVLLLLIRETVVNTFNETYFP